MKYACIRRHVGAFTVTLMCRVLGVSRAGYYAWCARTPSARAKRRTRLTVQIRAVHKKSKQRYGSPRVFKALRTMGIRVSRKLVARIMREAELRARRRRRFVVTTNSEHDYPIAPNLLDRRFDVGTRATDLDRVWVSDLTFVPTPEGWLYLAVVIDLASRRVIGWSTSDTPDTELTLTALRRAIALRRPAPGLLHHSDRGTQYAAQAYRNVLDRHGMTASMSRKGNCLDNAVAESFFATLEWELLYGAQWHSRKQAHQAIAEFIEIWYNRIRMHSSLNDLSPAAFEEMLAGHAAAA